MMERHRVAINATVSQQLATSKRVQMLSAMDAFGLEQFGLTEEEASGSSRSWAKCARWMGSRWRFATQDSHDWVLKNQEGGALPDGDILPRPKPGRLIPPGH